MNWQTELLLIPSIGGPLLIITGLIQFKFPPKEINSLYGYRSKRSKKSKESWVFAQEFSAKEMMKSGVYLSVFSCLGLVTNFDHKLDFIMGLLLSSLVLIRFMFHVEMTLKRKFDHT